MRPASQPANTRKTQPPASHHTGPTHPPLRDGVHVRAQLRDLAGKKNQKTSICIDPPLRNGVHVRAQLRDLGVLRQLECRGRPPAPGAPLQLLVVAGAAGRSKQAEKPSKK